MVADEIDSFTGSGVHVHRINDPHDRGIDGNILHSLGQTCARSGDDQYSFMVTGADRIHGHDITCRVAAIDVYGPHDEQLFAKQALVFLCGDHGPENARDDHA